MYKESTQHNLKHYLSKMVRPMASCISLLAHPIDEGVINTKKVYEIMCLAPKYTVDKRDDTHGEDWSLVAEDSYDLKSEITGLLSKPTQYKQVKVAPVRFLNERQAHEAVSSDLQKVLCGTEETCDWYDNSHSLIDEFVYKTTLMRCEKCNQRTSSKQFSGVPICRICRPIDRFEGGNIQPPKVLDITT